MLQMFMFPKIVFGQQSYPQAHTQLRNMFGNLSLPSPPKKYLYDMAVHATDESFFKTNSTLVGDGENWFNVYEELRNMAYDTTALLPMFNIYQKAMNFQGDTIPIGIMYNHYYTLKDNALNTNTYFDFDTTVNKIYDKALRPSYPYLDKIMFCASPLKQKSNYNQVVYRIDPDFIIRDYHTNWVWNNYQIQIDFGDGQGWTTISDPNSVSHYPVIYAEEGKKEMKIRLVQFWDDTTIAGTSMARLVVPNKLPDHPSDETFSTAGLDIHIYKACEGSRQFSDLNKVIILLEGIDIPDGLIGLNVPPSEVYEQHVKSTGLGQLRNYGYDFVVVSYKNSRISMKSNAMYVVELINILKERTRGKGNNEPFVVMGISMGGIIAKYALRFMETRDYTDANPAERHIMHNTRLYISVDSPHQGANIPVSLQQLYRDISNPALVAFSRVTGAYGARLMHRGIMARQGIDATSAKELLIYHADTRDMTFNPSYPSYTQNYARTLFMAQMDKMGGYPQFCKRIALASGSLRGNPQTRHDFDNAPREANDFLMKFNAHTYVRVLGYKIKISDANLELRTNPQGQGDLANINVGIWGITLKVKWFGIDIRIGIRELASYNHLSRQYAIMQVDIMNMVIQVN
jgi:hypothetical protein